MAAASPSASAEELVELVNAAQGAGTSVEVVDTETPGLPVTYLVYCQFALYALFGGIAAIVGVGLADLRLPEVRQRIGAAPVASSAFDGQIRRARSRSAASPYGASTPRWGSRSTPGSSYACPQHSPHSCSSSSWHSCS